MESVEITLRDKLEKALPDASKIKGIYQLGRSLESLAGYDAAVSLIPNIVSVAKNIKLATEAKKNGRTSDYRLAIDGALKALKSITIDSHPVMQFIRFVQRQISGWKNLTGKGESNMSKEQNGKNHPSWYLKYNLDSYVGLNFGKRKSIHDQLFAAMGVNPSQSNKYDESTTDAALFVEFTIPKDANNSFIQSMTMLYQKMRSVNSGSAMYNVADLTAYILNTRSLRAALMFLSRAVKSANYASPYDSDLPAKLIDIMGRPDVNNSHYYGFNSEAIIENRANLINSLNSLIHQVNELLPVKLALFDRTRWMMETIFKDSPTEKANTYQFVPTVFHIFANNSGTVGVSESISIHGDTDNTTSFSTGILKLISELSLRLTQVTSDPTNAIIAGDMLKTFGDAAFDRIADILVSDKPTIIYDEDALTQIQNASLIGSATHTYDLDSHVNFTTAVITNNLTWNYANARVNQLVKLNPKKLVTNASKDNISTGDQLAITRLQAFTEFTRTNSYSFVNILSCGTEVATGFKCVRNYNTTGHYYQCEALGDENNNACGDAAQWAILRYVPMIIVSDNAAVGAMFEFDNYAVSDQSQIDILHQFATLSLFATPDRVKRQNEFTFQ